MLEIKNAVITMNTAFGIHIPRLDMAEKTIGELESRVIETSQLKYNEKIE